VPRRTPSKRQQRKDPDLFCDSAHLLDRPDVEILGELLRVEGQEMRAEREVEIVIGEWQRRQFGIDITALTFAFVEVAAEKRYSGSQEIVESPVAVASALKLAGPSAHPRIRKCRSSKESKHAAILLE
jgi:hypothetical protein